MVELSVKGAVRMTFLSLFGISVSNSRKEVSCFSSFPSNLRDIAVELSQHPRIQALAESVHHVIQSYPRISWNDQLQSHGFWNQSCHTIELNPKRFQLQKKGKGKRKKQKFCLLLHLTTLT